MNNIQKNFKAKRGLCMAQGGMITAQRFTPEERGEDLSAFMNPPPKLGLADGTANIAQAAQPESPEQVMARMSAKYGVSTQPVQAAPVQAPQPVQQAPQPAPQRQGLMGAAMGLIGGRKAAIDRASNYAEGGIVRGKGGPTDDEVPMQVAGKDVNLSNSEAVLPVKTVHALGGPEAVEELIEETNGKPPVRGGLRAGGLYADGLTGSPQEAWAEHQSRQAAATAEKQALAQTAARAEATGAALAGDVANTEAAAATLRPTPPAPKPIGLGGRAMGALRAFATNPAMAIPTGVMATKAVADFVDSFPSLRGRATAEASNMELAGTPQHDAEVNKALVAQDAAWEQRHGKTLSDAQRTNGAAPAVKPKLRFEDLPQAGYSNEGRSKPQASVNPISTVDRNLVDDTLGKDAAVPQGLRNRWADNDPMKAQQYISKDNAASGLRNNPAQGHGVVSIKQGDGSFKNVLMAPSEYTGADGKPTNDWSKTAQFAQGTAQAAKDKASLRDLEYSNAKFNATSDQITDPNARAAGLRGLAQYDQEAALAAKVAESKAKNAPSVMDIAKFMQHERDVAQMQQNTVNSAAASAKKDARKDVREILGDMYEGDVEGKKAAQRYAANYNPIDQNKETPEQYQQGILEDLDMEAQLDAEGRHWLTPERGFRGTASMWKQRPAGLTDAFRGYLGGDVYEDPATGRVIKLPKGMSDAQSKKFLEQRLIK